MRMNMMRLIRAVSMPLKSTLKLNQGGSMPAFMIMILVLLFLARCSSF